MTTLRFLVLFLCIIFTSCSKHRKNRLYSLFEGKEKFSINASKVFLEGNQETLDFMFGLHYIDSILIADEFPNPNYCLKIVDLRNRKIFPFAEKGKGPGQINGQAANFSVDYKKRELFVTDKTNNYVYSIDSIIKYHTLCAPSYKFSIHLDSDNFMHQVYMNGRVVGGMYNIQFGMFDIKRDTLIKKGDYKEEGAMAWQSFLIPHPSRDIIAYFNYLSDGMGILDLTTDFDIKIVEIMSGKTSGHSQTKGNMTQVTLKNDAKNGYIAACASREYMYVLYSGKEISHVSREDMELSFLSNRVYVFDWTGKPIKYYDLDCKVRSIAVDLNDKVLYAASYEEDIPSLVFFDLINK